MKRAVTWVLVGLGITVASVAVFVLAVALPPGDPSKFYLIVAVALLALTLLWRMLGLPMR